jgi:glycosyltransferase involved in cell wall biosynthesis
MKKKVDNAILIGNRYSRVFHINFAKLTGFNGCFSYFSTRNFLRKLKKIKPDIIHLHNLHNCYINLPLLFKYIKKNNIKVLWTLHDCWAFTGQCAHFTIAKCDKWKTGCHHCKTYKEYPPSYVDRTKKMWKLKKKWFTGIKDATIITPSQWLGDLVKQSYLGEYPVKVINNGIDLSVFKPTESDFRKKHNLENKHILLGVALFWDYKKGLDVFIELSKRLDDRYQIVLVGTSDEVDKQLPNNIISIHRTQNQEELAEIYSTADVLLNPTREDTFPTVNIESLACGTPIVTFNTGGSPEIINETCGVVTEVNDVDHMEKAIRRICEEKPYSKEACVSRASNFDKDEKFKEYVELY